VLRNVQEHSVLAEMWTGRSPWTSLVLNVSNRKNMQKHYWTCCPCDMLLIQF